MNWPDWLKLLGMFLLRIFKWREDEQAKKAVLYDIEKAAQERKERADEITQEALDTELFDLDERMRHYQRD